MDNIFKFLELLHQFQQVKRKVRANGEDRHENDAEHSYQLAMLAWYLIESKKLKLDTDKAMRYALVHDLVEIHAGDTYFYASEQQQASKQANEAAALAKLEADFPELGEMWAAVHRYEDQSDLESKFIYALDKVLAPMNIYLDNGRSWKECRVPFEVLKENKAEKVRCCPDVELVFNELIAIIEVERDELFN
jgi:putative hydrolases of HD superfamily